MSQPTETLFVADVPQGTLQSDLAAIFASLPGYLSCRLRRDRNSETVGFVEYATVSEAEVARAERQGFVMQSGHRGLSIYFSHSPRGKRFDPQMFPQALQLHALPPVPPPMGYMNAPGSPMYPPPNSPSAFFAAAAAAAATGYPGSQIPPVFYVQQDFIANHNANDPPPSNTLYIQGLPSDATEREVAHIFRPFPGFEAVRLVQCPPRLPPLPHQVCPNPDGTLLILAGFVSFHDPYHAANALHLLQGYPLDLRRPDSALFLAFSRLRSIPPPPLSPASPSPSPSASPSPSPSPSSPHMSADTAATAAAAPHALQLTASSHQRPTHPTGQLSSSAGAPAPSSGASSPSSLQPHLHPHPHPHHYPHHPHHMLLHHHHYQLSHSHSMPLHHPTTHSPTLATRRRASLATSSPSSLESGGHERDSGRYNVSATASKRSLAQASVSSSAIVSTVAAEAEAEAEASTNEHGSASSSSSSSGSVLGSASTSVRTLVSSVSLLSSSSPSSSQQKAVDSVVSSSSSSSSSASASASASSSSSLSSPLHEPPTTEQADTTAAESASSEAGGRIGGRATMRGGDGHMWFYLVTQRLVYWFVSVQVDRPFVRVPPPHLFGQVDGRGYHAEALRLARLGRPSHNNNNNNRKTSSSYSPLLEYLVAHTPPDRVLATALCDRLPLESYTQGRTVLIGDAAHPFTPFIGQGASQALVDAFTLGRLIRQHIGPSSSSSSSSASASASSSFQSVYPCLDYERIGAEFDRMRLAAANALMLESRQVGDTMHRDSVWMRLGTRLLSYAPTSWTLEAFFASDRRADPNALFPLSSVERRLFEQLRALRHHSAVSAASS
mmetsp:Transcript_8145/g.25253  ORF Transcript_8145/g.25253 Transcript_8145/m.25253 type:complete len:838 (+) Transcript_8145:362-2875(+)